MASYGGRWLFHAGETSSGAILFLQRPARRNVEHTTAEGWSTRAARGQLGLVIRGPSTTTPDETLSRAVESAELALDMFAIAGGMACLLDHPYRLHVVWWPTQAGTSLRIWSAVTLRPETEMRLGVRDPQGKPVPSSPSPPTTWHPSFRYFRAAQATRDLLDAFRNLYLAIESLLSSVVPVRPNEREVDWLSRALGEAAGDLELSSYLSEISDRSCEQPVAVLVEEIYRTNRTAAFHAKDGRRILLPYSADERKVLIDSVRRLRRLYVDLVWTHLGVSFRRGTTLASTTARSMLEAVLSHLEVYVCPTLSSAEEMEGDAPDPPSGSLILRTQSVDPSTDGYEMTITAASPCPRPPPVIREFGGLLDGKVGLYESLDEDLDVEGAERLEVVLRARNEREGTAIPEYLT